MGAYDDVQDTIQEALVQGQAEGMSYVCDLLLKNCNTRVINDSDSIPVGHQLPPLVIHFLKSVQPGYVSETIIPSTWTLPLFNKVSEYVRANNIAGIQSYQLGNFNGTPIQGVMRGGVEVWGPLANFAGNGGSRFLTHRLMGVR
jgi:hypothetical protein